VADSPDGPWNANSDLSHLAVGNWTVAADGSISLAAGGPLFTVVATSDDACLVLTAGSTVTIGAGPASLVLASTEEGTVGGAVLGVGNEGSIGFAAGPEDEGSVTQFTPETTTLRVGPPDEGAQIQLTPESITLRVGPPGVGASIVLTPESITLKVAEVSWTMTAEGITEDVAEVTREMTAEGHNFTAAETEFNIGVAGQAAESPTSEAEVEAGTVENETLGSDTTDAAKNEDAGIKITE
jgi:hypothetical protein